MSRVPEILCALEEDILAGKLTPGERLDERRLADRFGVSRTPVREALHRLAAVGVVSLQTRQGATVVQLDVADLFDAFMIVSNLEGLAAAQAARRIRPEQHAALLEACEACAEAAREHDADAFNEANGQLHNTVLQASNNRLLAPQVRTAQILTAPYRRAITYQPGRMLASVDEHAAIVRAIVACDADGAAERMRRHVDKLAEGAADVIHHLRRVSDVGHVGRAPVRRAG